MSDETTRLRALLERATQTPWRQDGCEITVVGSTLGVDGGETVVAECTLPDCIEVADEDRKEQEERNAALIVATVNALPGLLDAADELRVLKAVRAARLQKMDEIVPQWRAACDAADSRAARAERERDDLAATLETRTAEHALAMERVRELEARLEFADRGLKTLTDAGWELATERDRLRAIIEGRTTPPTIAEARAHSHRARGAFVAMLGEGEAHYRARVVTGLQRFSATPQRWIALDADGRPCAWPTAEVSR